MKQNAGRKINMLNNLFTWAAAAATAAGECAELCLPAAIGWGWAPGWWADGNMDDNVL